MWTDTAIVIAMIISTCSSQLLVPPPAPLSKQGGIIYAQPATGRALDFRPRPHKDVVYNAELESKLDPSAIRSSKFYNNPAVAAKLAENSDLGEGEFRIGHREADNIPRMEILKIVQHAGFVKRR